MQFVLKLVTWSLAVLWKYSFSQIKCHSSPI